jgi:transposase
MESVATRRESVQTPALYMAMEVGERQWKLGFTISRGQPVRVRTVPARDLARVAEEIRRAKTRFRVPAELPVFSCYEAGRDGFWIHRALVAMGVDNEVVDSSSIEVKRRARRAKSDKLDVRKLAEMLVRRHEGEKRVWSVLRVPTPAQEDRRQLHRELVTAKRDRGRVVVRVKALLATQGVRVEKRGELPESFAALRMWNGEPLRAGLRERLERERRKARLLDEQIRGLVQERKELLQNASDPAVSRVRTLMRLQGIGIESAWLLSMELFSWRTFRNVREVGAVAGLCPTPYQSGEMRRELGITRAGNREVRAMMVEIAWGWLQYQPQSELAQWYQRRFGSAGPVQKKKGIVAVARRLLIALWKYLEHDELPKGAVLKR